MQTGFDLYTIYTLFIHSLYTLYTLFIHSLYTLYTLFIHYLYTLYTLFIHSLYTVLYTLYTLFIHSLRTLFTLFMHYIFFLLCFFEGLVSALVANIFTYIFFIVYAHYGLSISQVFQNVASFFLDISFTSTWHQAAFKTHKTVAGSWKIHVSYIFWSVSLQRHIYIYIYIDRYRCALCTSHLRFSAGQWSALYSACCCFVLGLKIWCDNLETMQQLNGLITEGFSPSEVSD